MTPGRPKRKYRLRRKRPDRQPLDGLAEDVASEVVMQFGCCLVEAVSAAGIVIFLFAVPAYSYWS